MTDLTDSSPAYRLITSADDLKRIMPDLMDETVVAVDVEADSMYHFSERACLIQMATPAACLLIDPLAVGDLSALRPLFLSPAITKIFHGASYDVHCLDKCCHISISNLFDTEIACRFLGLAESGLNAVVQQTFGITLDKKYQKKNWSQRPLPPEMLAYAARDVLYLIPLWTILKQRLREKQRTAWVDEECRLISIARPAADDDRPLFLKVKGSGRLDRRGLAVLENLLKKRLEIARRKDLPPFKILSNTALMRLAEERPGDPRALKRSKILSEKQLSMYADPVCQAIGKALAASDGALPVYPRQRQAPLSRKASLRVDALKQWREVAAGKIEMDASLILPNALVIDIARKKPQDLAQLDNVAEMKQWQKDVFGQEIVDVVKTLT